MTSLAINDILDNRELDADALGNLSGAGYAFAKGWYTDSVKTGNWGSWFNTSWGSIGFSRYNGKAYEVYKLTQKRYQLNSQERRAYYFYD